MRTPPRLPRRLRVPILLAGVLVVAIVAVLAVVRSGTSAPAASPAWRLPPANAGFDYQIGGPYTPQRGAGVVVRDWHVGPAPDHYDVCYVNVFETQAADEAWWMQQHPELVLRVDGTPVEDPNWPRQYLLDSSTAAKRAEIAGIVTPWIRSCARKGYEAVEFDNLDSWYRSHELLTVDDNLALARTLVDAAHGMRLAVAQKNGAVLKGEGRRVAHFDFAIAESCEVYDECDSYTGTYGARVFEIEYTDESGDPFARACAARGDRIAVIQRDRLVVPRGQADYRYDAC